MGDPDLQMEVGGNHPDPAIWGGLVSKKFFSALQASVWPKNKREGGGAAPPLDPPLGWSLKTPTAL